MGQHKVIYPRHRILPGQKQEWSSDSGSDMDEPPQPHAKWKAPTQKAAYYMIPFIGNVPNRKIHTTESKIVVVRDVGSGEWLLMGTGFFWGWWKCCGISGDGCTILWRSQKPLNCTILKGWILCYVNYSLTNKEIPWRRFDRPSWTWGHFFTILSTRQCHNSSLRTPCVPWKYSFCCQDA